ncbi:hypothetical protein [Roseateles sp.]|uniref:hypothetical protein n=1 Tax=Roseateles sp. TaxID=1971397 RepID=UPI00326346EE
MSLKSTLTPVAALVAALLAGCAQPRHVDLHADVRMNVAAPAWTPLPPPPTISVYIEPPMVQPDAVLVDVAPPPMLVEAPPAPPMPEAVWVGGYWGWQGQWVWCAGRWLPPPQPGYHWTQPYYEHRDSAVVYVAGHWAAAGVNFAPPAPGLRLSLQVSIGGGERPIGPAGVFIPPPPGSRAGLIIPAPIGTPPAVVVSAPPVVNVGMRVTNNNVTNNVSRNTTINNINHVTNITNVTNVTVVAPPTATANGQAFHTEVPAQAHLAAALPALVHAQAPRPTSTTPVANFSTGHTPPALPPAQAVRLEPAAPHGATPTSTAREPEPHAMPLQPRGAQGAEFARPPASPPRAATEMPTPHAMPASEGPRPRPQDDRPPEYRPQAPQPFHAQEPHPQPPHPEPTREALKQEAAHPQAQRHEAPSAPPADTHRPRPPAKLATPPEARHDEERGEHKPHRKDEQHREPPSEEAR